MIIVIFLLILATSLNLSAEADTRTYQIQPNVPVPPPTGYVMVPESRLQEMFTPQGPQINLKDLANTALATKNVAQAARLDVNTELNNYKKAAQNVADAEAVSKAAQQLISDRKKAKDAQKIKLEASIEKARQVSQTAKDHVKKIRDNEKAAKNPSDKSDAERAANITEEMATSVDATINQALAEVTKDNPPSFQSLKDATLLQTQK